MSSSGTRVRDTAPTKLRDTVLTRGARKRAGLPPPTPLFRGVPRFEQTPLGRRRKPSDKTPRVPGNDPSEDSDSSSDGEPVTWVQCDNKQCQKWRRIMPDAEVDLSRDWFCHMHPDPTQQSCEMPEMKFVVNKKRNFTFSRLGAGELVWARMTGYCPWPAVVSPDPWSQGEYITEEREGCIYHLEFLGKPRSHCWLPEEQVEPYHSSTLCSLGAIKPSKKLDFALQEAEALLPLASSDRVEQCEYQQDAVKVSPCQQLQGPGHPPKMKSKIKGKKCCPLGDSTNLRRNVTQKLPAADKAETKQALFQGMLSSSAKQSDLLPQLSLFQSLGISLTFEDLANILLKTSTASVPSTSKVEESGTSNVVNSGVKSSSPCTAKSRKPSLQRESPSHLQAPRTETVASTGRQKLLETRCRKSDKSSEVRKTTRHASNSAGKPHLQEKSLPRSTPLHVSPRLTQTALRLCADKTVQLTTAKTADATTGKKKKGSPSPSGSHRIQKRHKRESPPAATHTIPELFKMSDSPTLVSYPTRGSGTQGHNVLLAAENLDQRVPEQPEFLQLESDAQTEMKEIEEMLSLFGSDEAVGGGDSPLKRHGDPLAAADELEPHIDSVMAEMTQIEGLIQDLTRGQVVPY